MRSGTGGRGKKTRENSQVVADTLPVGGVAEHARAGAVPAAVLAAVVVPARDAVALVRVVFRVRRVLDVECLILSFRPSGASRPLSSFRATGARVDAALASTRGLQAL